LGRNYRSYQRPNFRGRYFKRKIVDSDKQLPSFAPPKDSDDGAAVISAGGAYGTYVDLDGTIRSEAELVTRYREMSLQPECDAAIDEIVTESIAIDENDKIRAWGAGGPGAPTVCPEQYDPKFVHFGQSNIPNNIEFVEILQAVSKLVLNVFTLKKSGIEDATAVIPVS
jgi:hypothetical protein